MNYGIYEPYMNSMGGNHHWTLTMSYWICEPLLDVNHDINHDINVNYHWILTINHDSSQLNDSGLSIKQSVLDHIKHH